MKVSFSATLTVPESYLKGFPERERRAAAVEFVRNTLWAGQPVKCVTADSVPFEMTLVSPKKAVKSTRSAPAPKRRLTGIR